MTLTTSTTAASSAVPSLRASHDHATLRQLLADQAFVGRLRTYARRLVPSSEAADLVQDSCVEALESKRSPEDPAACTTWMHVLMQRKAARQLRRAALATEDLEVDELEGEQAPRSTRDRLAWVQQQVAEGKLDADMLEQMVRHAEGTSFLELAQEAGQSMARLHQRLQRQRQRLQAAWKEEKEDNVEPLSRKGSQKPLERYDDSPSGASPPHPRAMRAAGGTSGAPDTVRCRHRSPRCPPGCARCSKPLLPACPRRRACSAPTSTRESARRYLERVEPAIQGCGGDAHTYRVVARVVRSFGLGELEALTVLAGWNARCQPPWSVPALRQEVRNALRYGKGPIGEKLGRQP